MSLLRRTLLWCCGFSQQCWNTSKHPGGPKMLCQIKLNQWIPLQDPPHFQTDPGPVRSPLAAQSQKNTHSMSGNKVTTLSLKNQTISLQQPRWIRNGCPFNQTAKLTRCLDLRLFQRVPLMSRSDFQPVLFYSSCQYQQMLTVLFHVLAIKML